MQLSASGLGAETLAPAALRRKCACFAPASAKRAARAGQYMGARRQGLRVAAGAAAGPHLMSFHIGETTVSFPLTREGGQELKDAMDGVMQTFAEKAKAERPKRWPAMEFLRKGGDGSGLLGDLQALEVYCNPNAHPTAFDAKVLISLATAAGVRVTTEGKLSAVRADVEAFLDAAPQQG